MRSDEEEELEEEIIEEFEEELDETPPSAPSGATGSTTERTVQLLIELVESLPTTPDPANGAVFGDHVTKGCVHPQTAQSLSQKITSAWSGQREEKIAKVLSQCSSMAKSLCSSLMVDYRDPSA